MAEARVEARKTISSATSSGFAARPFPSRCHPAVMEEDNEIERKTPEQAAHQDAVLDYVWTMLQQLIGMMSAVGLADQAARLSEYEH